MKRSLGDPYTSSAKARNQGHDDIQMAASTTAGSASKSSAADVSQEPFEVRYWYLPDKEKLIWKLLDEFQRRPRRRSASMEERSLANYIQKTCLSSTLRQRQSSPPLRTEQPQKGAPGTELTRASSTGDSWTSLGFAPKLFFTAKQQFC